MLFVAVLALTVLLPGKTLDDHHHIRLDDAAFQAYIEQSIVIIKVPGPFSMSKGSGIVVSERIVMTARHVVADAMLHPIVEFQGTSYVAEAVFKLDNTDAAFIKLREPIHNARPIEWNMDPYEGRMRAYAVGAWGSLTEITYSAGTIIRKAEHIQFGEIELDWVLNGTTMLFFGFSGGALVDAEGRLLGICFGASESGTKFVDCRPLREIAFKPDLFE